MANPGGYPAPFCLPPDARLQLLREQAAALIYDLPCAHEGADENVVLFRVNQILQASNVGLLCTQAVHFTNMKVKVKHNQFFDLMLIHAYPERTHVARNVNCQTLREVRLAIDSRVTGGCVDPSLGGCLIVSAGSLAYKHCPPQEVVPANPFPSHKLIPTAEGWVVTRLCPVAAAGDCFKVTILLPKCLIC